MAPLTDATCEDDLRDGPPLTTISSKEAIDAESHSKETVSTAPLTLPINQQKDNNNRKNGTEYDKDVPESASTLSSSASLDMMNKAMNDDIVEASDSGEDPAILNSCSSPYQAFLFSSEWLGSSEFQDMTAQSGGGNDDTDSVVSGGYFEPGDLDSSNWMKAIRMDGPTFGFAMIALATAVVHPVLFVAGAVAAFGALKAVGAGYEYCSGDGKNSASASAAAWEQYLLSLCHKEIPEEPTKELEMSEAPGEVDTPIPDPLLLSVPPTEVEATTCADSKLAPEPTAIEKETPAERAEDEGTPQPLQEPPPKTKQPPSTALVDQAYPALDNTVVNDVSFPGLHAIEFFRVFFADDAPYNFMELQKQRGDLDIVYGQWKELTPGDPVALHDGSKGNPKQAKQLSDGSQALNSLIAESKSSFQGRVLTFKAKTNNFIGPVYATTRKTQRVLLYHKTCIVMESRTDLSDIPFCDRFYVLERWIIRAKKVKDETGNAKYKYVSTLSASSQVVFSQSCQFASQIKTKSASTIKDLVTCWCTMAKEALKLTEQRKTLRLKHEQEGESEHDFDETDHEEESVVNYQNKNTTEKEHSSKENVPPHDDGEGIEVTWPKKDDNSSDRPKLKHSDSAPFPGPKKHKLHAFRRSVSNLWKQR